MAANTYECMLIFHPNQYARDSAGVSGQITTFVEKQNGKMLVSRQWDERKLAYPIDGQRKGTYWLSYFESEGTAIAKIERDCKVSNSILRALILKVDPRIAETLVSHALGKEAEKPAVEAAKPATDATPEAKDEAPATAAPEAAVAETATPEAATPETATPETAASAGDDS